VCGGFPTGSYAGIADSRRAQLAERQRDPEVWAETLAALDPNALIAFWDAVDELPPSELVKGLNCPVWSWWGGADPLFAPFGGVAAHRAVLDQRGLPYRELPGLDHDEALVQIDQLLPEVANWLEPLLRD
jgi:pimeloyl-ACP methyl ester carboxylesterase